MTAKTSTASEWHLPHRKPTIAHAMRLLELSSRPTSRNHLRQRMKGWREGSEGKWGCACGSVDEWVAVQRCRAAYSWLASQLPEVR